MELDSCGKAAEENDKMTVVAESFSKSLAEGPPEKGSQKCNALWQLPECTSHLECLLSFIWNADEESRRVWAFIPHHSAVMLITEGYSG